MSAFSTVGDVFSDLEFVAPGSTVLWGTGILDETCRDCTGFLIMPQRPHTWKVHLHSCCTFDNADLGFGPRDHTAHFPVFLHLRVTNLLGPDSIMRSSQAQQRRLERAAGKNGRMRLRMRLAQQSTSNPLATQPKFLTQPHTTSTTAFSQYGPNWKTPCAPSALYLSAHCERLPVLHCWMACSACHSGNTWGALSSTLPRRSHALCTCFFRFHARDAGLSRDIALLSRGAVRRGCPSVFRSQCFYLSPLWTRCFKSVTASVSASVSASASAGKCVCIRVRVCIDVRVTTFNIT